MKKARAGNRYSIVSLAKLTMLIPPSSSESTEKLPTLSQLPVVYGDQAVLCVSNMIYFPYGFNTKVSRNSSINATKDKTEIYRNNNWDMSTASLLLARELRLGKSRLRNMWRAEGIKTVTGPIMCYTYRKRVVRCHCWHARPSWRQRQHTRHQASVGELEAQGHQHPLLSRKRCSRPSRKSLQHVWK